MRAAERSDWALAEEYEFVIVDVVEVSKSALTYKNLAVGLGIE